MLTYTSVVAEALPVRPVMVIGRLDRGTDVGDVDPGGVGVDVRHPPVEGVRRRLAPVLSVTVTVTSLVPVVVGTPEISPPCAERSGRPAGR